MHWADRLASRLGLSLTDDPGALERLDDPDRVLATVRVAVTARLDVYGEFVNAFERRKLRALSVDPETFDLGVVLAPGIIPPRLRLFFTLDHLTWSFDAEVIAAGPDLVTVRTPRSLSFGEHRHARRWSLSAQAGASARLPGDSGSRPVPLARLLDLSRSGLAVRAAQGANGYHAGQRIRRMDLLLDAETIPLSHVEIRHVTPIDGSEDVRIGLEVGVGRRPLHVREVRFPLPAPPKTSRRPCASRDGGARPEINVVRYGNARGERIVAILDTTFGEKSPEPSPVVILPPATGRRKETLSALARIIIENFRGRQKHVAVLRFDGIRRHGESTNDPEGRKPGMEMVHYTMGQAIEDIHTTLDFVYQNERLQPSRVAVVSMSAASIEARRAIVEDGGRRIHYWISLAGVPDFHDTLKSMFGGIDLLGTYRNGVSLGIAPILGNPIDMDRAFSDAFARRLVYLRDALSEIPEVRIPVTWISGKFDAWVRPERVMNLMTVRSEAKREILVIPTGHEMRTSEEAIEAFKLVTTCLWRFFYGSAIRPFAPPLGVFAEMREAEKARLVRPKKSDHRGFWKEYLERKGRYLGMDILRETKAYQDLMSEQLKLLDLHEGVVLMDAGCGTGNFIEFLMKGSLGSTQPLPMPGHVTLTDYVPEALATTREKLQALISPAPRSLPDFEVRCVDLEISRLHPVARALEDDGFEWKALRGAVEGLPAALLCRFEMEPEAAARRAARGDDPRGLDAPHLSELYGVEGAEILEDLGRAARFVRHLLVSEDLREPERFDLGSPKVYDRLDASALTWKRLNFGRATLRYQLDFPDGSYDRIVSSLVVCYLFRPEATIREFYRLLRPGGVLVISSMKPDADVSRIYMRLINRLQSSEEVVIPDGFTREDLLNSARTFLNKAAGILNLEEAGAFEFLPRHCLADMFKKAGFQRIRTIDSFGNPPQAYIVSGVRA